MELYDFQKAGLARAKGKPNAAFFWDMDSARR